MQKLIGFFVFTFIYNTAIAQNYISYFTGNPVNITTTPEPGICLMGGATENDEAMKWFLQRCHGGDVLVLRASGSNGYNDYLYSELGVAVNSVESIVCTNTNAGYDPYILQKIQQAEAIWFAGGDQWVYINYWRNTPVANMVNDAIKNRHIVVGGTSAGMAILGRFYFSAQNGTVTSAAALANPYDPDVTVDSVSFLRNTILDSVITDTHYDNPDRRGRQTTFLARMKKDWNFSIKGIACDEYTAVCIDNNGLARVYGDYPSNDDNAYFIQSNCEIPGNSPEVVSAGIPLTWNQGNQALKVYNLKGNIEGSNTFNLNDWKTGVGGNWQRWYVANGSWQSSTTTSVNCIVVPVSLTDFTAKKENQQVLLEWKTVTEINNHHFELQKSNDGINFHPLKTIAATGNSNQLRSYSYIDTDPSAGLNYYRLQQVDINGSSTYSRIVKVNFTRDKAFSIYPNPVKDGKIHIETNGTSFQQVVIINMAGQQVLQQSFISDTQQDMNISALQKGIYFIKLLTATGSEVWTSKLIIQ